MADTLTKEIDELISNRDFDSAYDKLKKGLESEENQTGELYWRMARICRDMANNSGDNKEKNKAYMYEAFDNSKKGVEKEPENWSCNKWYAILLDLTARFEGIKKRIENSYLVKDHLMKAIEKNPSDATTLHSLGVWCFELSDLPWYQQKIASAFFATPPTSTYEEGLNYFLKAEEVSPNFYSYNLLYLGKSYLRLKRKDEAKVTLKQCVEYNGSTVDDNAAKKEATDLLKKL